MAVDLSQHLCLMPIYAKYSKILNIQNQQLRKTHIIICQSKVYKFNAGINFGCMHLWLFIYKLNLASGNWYMPKTSFKYLTYF